MIEIAEKQSDALNVVAMVLIIPTSTSRCLTCAEILADVYLLMTGGQTKLNLKGSDSAVSSGGITRVFADRQPFKVVQATVEELAEHQARLDLIAKESGQYLE